MQEGEGKKKLTLMRCPPYCRSNCVMQHHPLLVVLLNCFDTDDQERMEGRIKDLAIVVKQYKEMGWNPDKEVIDVREKYRLPLIHWACALGRIRALKWMLENEFSPVAQMSETGDTGLHRACMSLQETCPSEAIPKFRQILPLMEQALAVQNKEGDTPLHFCCEMLQSEMPNMEFFRDCVSAMVYYSKQKSEAFMVIYLNTQNAEGNTALHLLSQSNKHYNLVKMLTEAGTNTRIMNSKGLTPLSIALEYGQFKLASFFAEVSSSSSLRRTGRRYIDTEPLLDKEGKVIGQVVRRVGGIVSSAPVTSITQLEQPEAVTTIMPSSEASSMMLVKVEEPSPSTSGEQGEAEPKEEPKEEPTPVITANIDTIPTVVDTIPTVVEEKVQEGSTAQLIQGTTKTAQGVSTTMLLQGPTKTEQEGSTAQLIQRPTKTEQEETPALQLDANKLLSSSGADMDRVLEDLIDQTDLETCTKLTESVKAENIECRRKISIIDARISTVNKRIKEIEKDTLAKSDEYVQCKRRMRQLDDQDVYTQEKLRKIKANLSRAEEAYKSLQARLRHCQSALDALASIE